MFDENKYRLPDLQSRGGVNSLLLSEITSTVVRPGYYARGWALIAGVILLAGLICQVRAAPENAQGVDAKSSIDLSFPATAPITLSKMMTIGQSGIWNAPGMQLGYDIDSEVASEATRQKDDYPYDAALTWKSGLAAKTQSEAIKLASNIDAAHMESEDNALEGEKPLIEEAVRSPFATIALAVLALLGLVSIARRNDI